MIKLGCFIVYQIQVNDLGFWSDLRSLLKISQNKGVWSATQPIHPYFGTFSCEKYVSPIV